MIVVSLACICLSARRTGVAAPQFGPVREVAGRPAAGASPKRAFLAALRNQVTLGGRLALGTMVVVVFLSAAIGLLSVPSPDRNLIFLALGACRALRMTALPDACVMILVSAVTGTAP